MTKLDDGPLLEIPDEDLKSVGIHEAKTHLSRLIEELAETRNEIIITNRGREVARLIPSRQKPKRQFGRNEAWFRAHPIPDDAFAWTDEEIAEMFEADL